MMSNSRTTLRLAFAALLTCTVVGLSPAGEAAEPRADAAATVRSGNARFTVLTSRLCGWNGRLMVPSRTMHRSCF